MKSNLKLYGSLICPYVQRVRFFLEQAKIPYEYQEVNLLTKEHHQEWYKTINPSMKVPSLILNESKIIVESLVINEFLCEAFYPQALPTDSFERSNIRRWICYLSDNILSLYMPLLTKFKEDNIEEFDISLIKLQENWSNYVANSSLSAGSKFLFGDSVGLADFATLPFIQNEEIIIRKVMNRNLFESKEQKTNENLKLLQKYFEYAKENTEFLTANKKVRILPLEEKDPIIKSLGMKTFETYDYEEYAAELYRGIISKK